MTDRKAFLGSLPALKAFLLSDTPEREEIIQRAYGANQWFVPSFTIQALEAIANEFLDEEKCRKWIESYVFIQCHTKDSSPDHGRQSAIGWFP
ncbi:MAG: hypothetical protein IPL92_18805 [Saprospiraceae bacterium]|nr:hypothetical protein [Candidatus Opimibacter iunctus]